MIKKEKKTPQLFYQPEELVFQAHFLFVLEKKIATLSSILVWRIPWTKEPGRLQSTGSQRVGHN